MAFIVTRRQDKEQQQVHSLLRSPPEPQGRCPTLRGLCCSCLYRHPGRGGLLGRPCQKQGGEESLAWELLGHHQKDEKEGSCRKRELGKRGVMCACVDSS